MIEIRPYQDRWPGEFASVGLRLRSALGEVALRIDHIGSTAVPGMAAKDVIDVQVTVTTSTQQPLCWRLADSCPGSTLPTIALLAWTCPQMNWRSECSLH